MSIQIHIGYSEPRQKFLKPRLHEPVVWQKPFGAFWTSTFIDNDTISDWVDWAIDNMQSSVVGVPVWKIQVADSDRVFHITRETVWDFVRRYEVYDERNRVYGFRWAKVRNDGYYGVRLSCEIAHDYEWRFRPGRRGPDFYTWDCESTAWIAPEAFDLFTSIERIGYVKLPTTAGDEYGTGSRGSLLAGHHATSDDRSIVR